MLTHQKIVGVSLLKKDIYVCVQVCVFVLTWGWLHFFGAKNNDWNLQILLNWHLTNNKLNCNSYSKISNWPVSLTVTITQGKLLLFSEQKTHFSDANHRDDDEMAWSCRCYVFYGNDGFRCWVLQLDLNAFYFYFSFNFILLPFSRCCTIESEVTAYV